jgi:hypothetical protein
VLVRRSSAVKGVYQPPACLLPDCKKQGFTKRLHFEKSNLASVQTDPKMGRDMYKDLTVRVRSSAARGRGAIRFAPSVHVRVFRAGERPSAAFEAYRLRLRHARLIVWHDEESKVERGSALKN